MEIPGLWHVSDGISCREVLVSYPFSERICFSQVSIWHVVALRNASEREKDCLEVLLKKYTQRRHVKMLPPSFKDSPLCSEEQNPVLCDLFCSSQLLCFVMIPWSDFFPSLFLTGRVLQTATSVCAKEYLM